MKDVKSYYRSKESRLGYKYLLRGVRHFGYYPNGSKISHKKAQENMMAIIGEYLGLKQGAKVLDVGCGEGATAITLIKKYGFKVKGVDLLEESVQIAKEKALNQGVDAEFKVGDFSKLPFEDSYFDGLYALESFIHATEPQKAMREFKRVLKPGGKLIIADYTTTPADDIDQKYRKALFWVSRGGASPGILSINHGYYRTILPKLGFHDISVKDITVNITPMLKWFYRLSFIPYQIVRLFNWQEKYVNTTMAYFGKRFAENGWWRFVVVSANKKPE